MLQTPLNTSRIQQQVRACAAAWCAKVHTRSSCGRDSFPKSFITLAPTAVQAIARPPAGECQRVCSMWMAIVSSTANRAPVVLRCSKMSRLSKRAAPIRCHTTATDRDLQNLARRHDQRWPGATGNSMPHPRIVLHDLQAHLASFLSSSRSSARCF